MEQKNNTGISIVSMIMGIASIVFSFALMACAVYSAGLAEIIPLIMAVVALVLGIMAAKRCPDSKGMATVGIITGAIGLAISAITLVSCFGMYGCVLCAGIAESM